MTRVIYKYPVQMGRFSLDLPGYYDVLHVGTQQGETYMWVTIEPEQPTHPVTFEVVGTGHPVQDDDMMHVYTWQDGPMVWHLFELFV